MYNVIYCESLKRILKPRKFRCSLSIFSLQWWNAVSRCSFAQCLHCSSPLTLVWTVYVTHLASLKLLPVFSLSFWDIITLLYPSLLASTSLIFPILHLLLVHFTYILWWITDMSRKLLFIITQLLTKKSSAQTPGLQSRHQQAWAHQHANIYTDRHKNTD